ncbi:hypothetical protein [Azonexus sp.]|uniref:hypothetical protein n=1 Tax=Azonexus sp. TaxID=1872668 RepID=UPI0035B3DAF7
MSRKTRYAMLTVDTEALPRRAAAEHVKRLIWGEHVGGTAGIREMCRIGDEFAAPHVFFVDVCAAQAYGGEMDEVIRWLDKAGHDVQLHAHPEYLPAEFWQEHGFEYRPRFMNQFDLAKAEFTLRHFGKRISDITGKPILAFRAGSFRWNANTLRALEGLGIPLSFNNSMRALEDGVCPHAEPTNSPFAWSNGVIEIPVTERSTLPFSRRLGWQRASFPHSGRFFSAPWHALHPFTWNGDDDFLVLLLHSWSLLYWDENDHAQYQDDRRIESYRRLVRKLSRDYDIITSSEFLDLHARDKIKTPRRVDLALTELRVPDSQGKIIW